MSTSAPEPMGTPQALALWLSRSQLVPKTQHALLVSWQAVVAWGDVLLVLGGPPVRASARWQLGLSVRGLVLEAAFVALLASLWLLRRWLAKKRYGARLQAWARQRRAAVQARYAVFKREVAHKSRIAAWMMPHLVFLGVARLVSLAFPVWAGQVVRSPNLEAVIVATRVLMTVFTISEAESLQRAEPGAPGVTDAADANPASRPASATVQRRRKGTGDALKPGTAEVDAASNGVPAYDPDATRRSVSNTLMYWVVFAIIIITQRVAAYTPLLGRLVVQQPHLAATYALVLIWLQLPFGGVGFAYDVLIPVIERYAVRIRTPLDQVDAERTVFWLRVLVMMRLLTQAQADLVSEVSRDGWVLVLSVPFVFTPGFFTKFGCLLSGLMYPSWCSIKLLSDASSNNVTEWQVRWLKFWAVHAVAILVAQEFESILRWVPLLYHLNLVLIVWMQLPYFRGAVKVYDRALMFVLGTLTGAGGDAKQTRPGGQASAPALEGPKGAAAIAETPIEEPEDEAKEAKEAKEKGE